VLHRPDFWQKAFTGDADIGPTYWLIDVETGRT